MKRNFPWAVGIFSFQFLSSAFANSVSDAARPVAESGDARIHEVNSPSQGNQAAHSLAEASSAEHIVRSGDNLEKISRLHGCRVSDLIQANDLKTDSVIHPGQKIKLPAKDLKTLVGPAPPSANTKPAAPVHTVAPGETFAAIARQHDIPLQHLLAANPEIKPTSLRPGQKVSLGAALDSPKKISLDAGGTQLVLATKEGAADADPTPATLLASPPTVKIQQIKLDREMTYHEFASRQGTNTRRLNQLNGLDLLDSALLAKGSELLAPAQP